VSGTLDSYSTHTRTLIQLECPSLECYLSVSVNELLSNTGVIYCPDIGPEIRELNMCLTYTHAKFTDLKKDGYR
jgi:hypothetical protein